MQNVINSGTCGDNLTWTLDDAGILTISGTGDMTNYAYDDGAPWYANRRAITSVTIGDSVTAIGEYAFSDCLRLKSVTIGNSVTYIGEYAFCKCDRRASVYYGGTAEQWAAIVIREGNDALKAVKCREAVKMCHYCKRGNENSGCICEGGDPV